MSFTEKFKAEMIKYRDKSVKSEIDLLENFCENKFVNDTREHFIRTFEVATQIIEKIDELFMIKIMTRDFEGAMSSIGDFGEEMHDHFVQTVFPMLWKHISSPLY